MEENTHVREQMLNYQLKRQQFFKNLKVSQAVQHKAFLSARLGGVYWNADHFPWQRVLSLPRGSSHQ